MNRGWENFDIFPTSGELRTVQLRFSNRLMRRITFFFPFFATRFTVVPMGVHPWANLSAQRAPTIFHD